MKSSYHQGYSFYRYEDVESKWLKIRDDLLPPETLCWVLQSKGKKRGRKGQPIQVNNTTTTATTSTTATATSEETTEKNDEHEHDHEHEQRKQLFNRAWVVIKKGEEEEEDEDTNTNNGNNNNNNNNNNNHNKNDRRILVRYPKGSTYHVKKENLLPVLQQEALVIVLPETRIYRRWCLVHTKPNDSFCEIGCDVGILVDRIREHSLVPQNVSGMDKSTTSIHDAKRRYPKSKFLEWSVPLEDEHEQPQQQTDNNDNDNEPNNDNDEAKNHEKEQEQQKQQTPLPMNLFPLPPKDEIMNKSLVVAIDINGNRGLKAVQQCVQIVIQEWKPRLLIVKSRALYHDLATERKKKEEDKKDKEGKDNDSNSHKKEKRDENKNNG